MPDQKPSIQFILPMAGQTGGVAVVYRYANALQRAGYSVRIIYPGVLYPKQTGRWKVEAPLRSLKYKVDAVRGKSEASWFPLEVPLKRVPSLEGKYLPHADITVVTSCETAEWAGKYPEKLGKVFYLIQAYEDWAMPVERLHQTFQLPFHKFTVSTWLKREVEKYTSDPVEMVILNGVNTATFFPPKPDTRPNQIPTVLMLSHPLPNKGVADGVTVIQTVREQIPNLKLVCFGAEDPHPLLPPHTEYHQSISPEKVRTLYQQADVFLCPALHEGGPLTNMEAMACATAVVTTDVGAVRDYAVSGETALICPPHDIAALTDSLLDLLQHSKKARQLAAAGQKHIQQFSWEAAEQQAVRYLTRND